MALKIGHRVRLNCFKNIQKYQGDFEVVFILRKDEVEPQKAKNWPSDKVFLMPVLQTKVSEDMSRCVETWSHVVTDDRNQMRDYHNECIDKGCTPLFWYQKGLSAPEQITLSNMRCK